MKKQNLCGELEELEFSILKVVRSVGTEKRGKLLTKKCKYNWQKMLNYTSNTFLEKKCQKMLVERNYAVKKASIIGKDLKPDPPVHTNQDQLD